MFKGKFWNFERNNQEHKYLEGTEVSHEEIDDFTD